LLSYLFHTHISIEGDGFEGLQTKKTQSSGPKRVVATKPKRIAKETGINVGAILKSGSKGNVTNQTVALMTAQEAESLATTAGVSMLKEAKKGLRMQAFKVLNPIPHKSQPL
jgi:hypothetical protein